MSEVPLRACSQAIINDPLGLHLRPAAELVVLAKSFRSDIRIVAKGTIADGKSLLELLVLAIECGTTLECVAEGPDAEQAVAALTGLIRAGFDGSNSRGAVAA